MTAGATDMTATAKSPPAKAEPTVAAGFVRALLELAVAKGASRRELLRRAEIDAGALEDQDNRIALARYVALMRAGKELCNDPALALHFGEAYGLDELSVVGLIGLASETLADAFVQLNRYARLTVDVDGQGDRLQLSRENGQLWVVDMREHPNDSPELTESGFARMACMPRRFPGGQEFIREVHVTHAAPSYRAEYDRIFRVPVVFGASRNAIRTDDAWLALTSVPGQIPSRYVFGALSERAAQLLRSLEDSQTVRGRVERLLMPVLHTGDASAELIAARMGTSRRTLYRSLKAEGVTFAEVLDALRHRLALDYLGEKKVSVRETAYLTGFSETAAFARAFKRWTGHGPGAARKARRPS